MQIKIESYKQLPDSKIKGICTITIDINGTPLTIGGVKVIVSPKSGYFYALPTREAVDKDTNAKKFIPICAFYTKEGYKEFHSSMTKAFTDFFTTKPAPVPQQASLFDVKTSPIGRQPTKVEEDECPF